MVQSDLLVLEPARDCLVQFANDLAERKMLPGSSPKGPAIAVQREKINFEQMSCPDTGTIGLRDPNIFLGGSSFMTRRLDSTRLQKRLLETEEVRALITERAHQLYVQRGAEPGKEMDDWLRAENDILQLAPFIECAFRTHQAWLGVPYRSKVHASLAQIDASRTAES